LLLAPYRGRTEGEVGGVLTVMIEQEFPQDTEDWRKIAREISEERDPEKLLVLIQELIAALGSAPRGVVQNGVTND
jgi:hypothetical protein